MVIECGNGEMITADHVIITVPLGRVASNRKDMHGALFACVLIFQGEFNSVDMTQNTPAEKSLISMFFLIKEPAAKLNISLAVYYNVELKMLK